MQSGIQKPLDGRHRDVERMACVVLDPLADVGVGVLMAVLVRRRQLVVNLERSSKGSQRQDDQSEGERNPCAGQMVNGRL